MTFLVRECYGSPKISIKFVKIRQNSLKFTSEEFLKNLFCKIKNVITRNFSSDLIWIRGLNTRSKRKVMGLQNHGSPNFDSFRTPKCGIKCHLDVGLMEKHIMYNKGEGGGFPQIWAMVSLVSSRCLWLVLAPKVF
jgi:hypothetical protein